MFKGHHTGCGMLLSSLGEGFSAISHSKFAKGRKFKVGRECRHTSRILSGCLRAVRDRLSDFRVLDIVVSCKTKCLPKFDYQCLGLRECMSDVVDDGRYEYLVR